MEGSTISSMIYPTLRINYCLLLLIRGLQSPGPGFFEPFPAYQTLPDTLFFSFPALTDRCYCGLPPSAPRWGQVPGVVRRLKFPFDCCSDENRCSCSYSRNRCSHSTSTHRHSGSRCCCHDKPHGLWEAPPFHHKSTIFTIYCSTKRYKTWKQKYIFDGLTPVMGRCSPHRETPDVLSLRSRFDALRCRLCHLAYRFIRHDA